MASLLIHAVALRQLPAAEYALLGLVLVVTAGLQALLAGGIPNAVRRAAGAGSDPAALRLAPAMTLHLALCGGVWLGLLGLAWVTAGWIGTANSWPVMAAAASELLVRAGLVDPSVFVLNGQGRYRTQAALQITFQTGRVVLFVTLLRWGPADAMLGLALAALAAGCAGLWLVRPPRGRRGAEGDSPAMAADLAAWLRYGGSHDGLLFLIPVANLCLVKTLVGDAGEVAVYIACFVAARATAALGITSAGMLFAPTARAVSMGDPAAARSLLAAAVRVQVLVLAPLVAFGSLRGAELLQAVCGLPQRPSGLMLGTLLAAGALLTLWAFMGEMLAAAGQLRGRLVLAAGLAGVGLPGMAAAASAGDALGAAAGLLAIAAAGAMGSMMVARGALGPFLPSRGLLCTIAAAVIAAWVLPAAVFPAGIAWGLVDVAVRTGFYLGMVVVMHRAGLG